MTFYKYIIFTFFLLLSGIIKANIVDYDIIYVRYPAPDITGERRSVIIPQGEQPYSITPGADLMRLLPDGTEEILIDCEFCSVMDPYISYDAKWVYYSLIEEEDNTPVDSDSASWIYKIDLTTKPYVPIRLTFNDGFDSKLYAGNTTDQHDQESTRKIRDMSPVPLADGRLLFTSNRSALTAFRPGTNAWKNGSVQQLYTMDDHDGSANTKALSNITKLEYGNIHLVQHPMQLKDGRLLFSSWQDFGTKFRYAMTSLFTLNPDGSNLKQFTEPHDHHQSVDHFVAQLTSGDVVSALYYPSFDYGFGILMRSPLNTDKVEFLRDPIDQKNNAGGQISFRDFDRLGAQSLTPHTTGADIPAPNRSGKYSMPSAAKDDNLLVAYSSGSVNHFSAVCSSRDLCDPLMSGIYLLPSSNGNLIESPDELIMIKDDPNYNEIWPRAVLPYSEIYGQDTPDIIPTIETSATSDSRLSQGEAAGLMGTSSMYNRQAQSNHPIGPDPFQSNSSRIFHDGNWTIQGAEAGVFDNSEIYAVRIMGSPTKPFTEPVSRFKPHSQDTYREIRRYLADSRLERVIARYGSLHNERWEVIGEFPLTNRGTIDGHGNPDTSWIAKVPADTPLFIQALDKNGMTIVNEQTWRALKPGEKRVDCGGCHAHSLEPLDFESTEAGKQSPIKDVEGIENNDSRIQQGVWDLTQGSIPLLTDEGVTFKEGYSLDVEFNRDVLPIINNKCISCHTEDGTGNMLILDGTGENDAYGTLTYRKTADGRNYIRPQRSKYIRVPQARQSLLTWVVYGERLDGRTNEVRPDDPEGRDTSGRDIDYPENHPALTLSDLEKRTFARWIDLGSPINFPETDGFGYTDDNQLPIINIHMPTINDNGEVSRSVILGITDAKSGVNWSTLTAKYYTVNSNNEQLSQEANIAIPAADENSVISFNLPSSLAGSSNTILEISVEDNAGNQNLVTRRFLLVADPAEPEPEPESEPESESEPEPEQSEAETAEPVRDNSRIIELFTNLLGVFQSELDEALSCDSICQEETGVSQAVLDSQAEYATLAIDFLKKHLRIEQEKI